MLTVRAAARASAAPRASTRTLSPASVVSIRVTVISYHTVRLRVARRFGALPDPRHVGVGLPRTRKQFLHPMDRVRHGVSDERQRWSEPNTGPGADFGAQHTLGPLQSRCGTRVI